MLPMLRVLMLPNAMDWSHWWDPAHTTNPVNWAAQWWFVIPLEHAVSIWFWGMCLGLAACYTLAAWCNDVEVFWYTCWIAVGWIWVLPVAIPLLVVAVTLSLWWNGVQALRHHYVEVPKQVAARLRGEAT